MKPIKSPRALTVRDLTLMRGCTAKEMKWLLRLLRYGNCPTLGAAEAQLTLANAMNDMVPSLNGFDQLPYLPGDLVLCKLNIVKLKKPRRNPWYRPRPVLCSCDQRAAKANGDPS